MWENYLHFFAGEKEKAGLTCLVGRRRRVGRECGFARGAKSKLRLEFADLKGLRRPVSDDRGGKSVEVAR